MERKKEFFTLTEALSAKYPVAEVTKVSRCILMERVNSVECIDNEILQIVKKLVSLYTPRIDVEITNTQLLKREPSFHNKDILKSKKMLSYGAIALLGLCLSSCNSEDLDKISFLGFSSARLLGSILLGGSTAFAIKSAIKDLRQDEPSIETKFKIKQKVEDIIIDIDNEFDCLKQLLYHNQLENQYSSILQWLQNLWIESNDELRKEICKLLAKIKYEFIEYDPSISAYFDSNKTADIDKPTTTRPAVRNKNTGEIVERGYVIIPM